MKSNKGFLAFLLTGEKFTINLTLDQLYIVSHFSTAITCLGVDMFDFIHNSQAEWIAIVSNLV